MCVCDIGLRGEPASLRKMALAIRAEMHQFDLISEVFFFFLFKKKTLKNFRVDICISLPFSLSHFLSLSLFSLSALSSLLVATFLPLLFPHKFVVFTITQFGILILWFDLGVLWPKRCEGGKTTAQRQPQPIYIYFKVSALRVPLFLQMENPNTEDLDTTTITDLNSPLSPPENHGHDTSSDSSTENGGDDTANPGSRAWDKEERPYHRHGRRSPGPGAPRVSKTVTGVKTFNVEETSTTSTTTTSTLTGEDSSGHHSPKTPGHLIVRSAITDENEEDMVVHQPPNSHRLFRLSQMKSTPSLSTPAPPYEAQSVRRRMMSVHRHLPTSDNDLLVYAVTWNMHEQDIPLSLEPLLFPEGRSLTPRCHIYAIATQEGTMARRNWELKLQETLGSGYVLVHSHPLMGIHLCVFVQRDLIWETSGVEAVHVATKMGGMLRTKGGVGIALRIKNANFLFVDSHLAAHSHNVKQRNEDFHTISRNMLFSKHSSRASASTTSTRSLDSSLRDAAPSLAGG